MVVNPCTPVAEKLEGPNAQHVLAPVRNFIKDRVFPILIDLYPDLYWMTVFANCQEANWPTAPIKWNDGSKEVATIPTLLDNHGLIPEIDHWDDDVASDNPPHVYRYRHLPRPRVEQLKATYESNQDFYNRIFHPLQRRSTMEENIQPRPVAWIQSVTSAAIEGDSYRILEKEEILGINKDKVAVKEDTLRINLLQGELVIFGKWLRHVLTGGKKKDNPIPKNKTGWGAVRIHRFRLGFALTLFAQYRRDISRIKGMAYDLEVNVTEKIGLRMQQVTQDPQVQFDYMKAMVRLLNHSDNFVQHFRNPAKEGYDPTGRLSFVSYLEHLGVASQNWWNQWPFWQQAIDAADAEPLGSEGFQVNNQHVYNEHEWIFLQMISVFPPLAQVKIHHFMEVFVDSMIDHAQSIARRNANVELRTKRIVYAQDSIRAQAEYQNAGRPLKMGDEMAVQLDPFDVRAKIVWLLFMVPYIDQLAYQGGGAPAAAAWDDGPQYGAQPRGQDYARGGQVNQMPHPSQFNQGSYNPHVYYNNKNK